MREAHSYYDVGVAGEFLCEVGRQFGGFGRPLGHGRVGVTGKGGKDVGWQAGDVGGQLATDFWVVVHGKFSHHYFRRDPGLGCGQQEEGVMAWHLGPGNLAARDQRVDIDVVVGQEDARLELGQVIAIRQNVTDVFVTRLREWLEQSLREGWVGRDPRHDVLHQISLRRP
ncbi:hypothetical protein ACIBG6_36590 [Streptomyces sp. NPDC050842]|uniref:hypothetical protein n=1 Tax=Streptomyces sp. NPDC050842 TaxID=3365636 RepID=UPI0037BB46F1